MTLEKTFIPYGGYYSTPFCRWQGALAEQHALKLAAETVKRWLAEQKIDAETFDSIVTGHTVPQAHSFYGAPWMGGLIGAPSVTGPTVAQACATSVRAIATAAADVETGVNDCTIGITFDRTSNGPHIYYPNPKGIGGRGTPEDPVWDNFNRDPFGKTAMIQTAENVAKKVGITKEEQDEVTLLRHEQYGASVADDRAFQKRYMYGVELRKGKKTMMLEEDEGVFPTTKEGLAKLRPVQEDGSVSFGTQTFPADGNAAMIVTTKERAEKLSKDKVSIQLLGFGSARVDKAFMPMAVVPAAKKALEHANLTLAEMKAVKTHNPFAVNDVFFAREMGLATNKVNNYGSPLIYGHPQGPTGMRAVIEMIEELVLGGGGHGVFSGCAAGDTAMALVLKVG